MSDAIICDRCEQLFRAPPQVVIQLSQGKADLCPECAEDLEEWWDTNEDEENGQTIRDQLSGAS